MCGKRPQALYQKRKYHSAVPSVYEGNKIDTSACIRICNTRSRASRRQSRQDSGGSPNRGGTGRIQNGDDHRRNYKGDRRNPEKAQNLRSIKRDNQETGLLDSPGAKGDPGLSRTK